MVAVGGVGKRGGVKSVNGLSRQVEMVRRCVGVGYLKVKFQKGEQTVDEAVLLWKRWQRRPGPLVVRRHSVSAAYSHMTTLAVQQA